MIFGYSHSVLVAARHHRLWEAHAEEGKTRRGEERGGARDRCAGGGGGGGAGATQASAAAEKRAERTQNSSCSAVFAVIIQRSSDRQTCSMNVQQKPSARGHTLVRTRHCCAAFLYASASCRAVISISLCSLPTILKCNSMFVCICTRGTA